MDETEIIKLINEMPKNVKELTEKLTQPKGLRSLEELQAIAGKISVELMEQGLAYSEMAVVARELNDFSLAQAIRNYIKTMDQVERLKANQQLENLNARHQPVV